MAFLDGISAVTVHTHTLPWDLTWMIPSRIRMTILPPSCRGNNCKRFALLVLARCLSATMHQWGTWNITHARSLAQQNLYCQEPSCFKISVCCSEKCRNRGERFQAIMQLFTCSKNAGRWRDQYRVCGATKVRYREQGIRRQKRFLFWPFGRDQNCWTHVVRVTTQVRSHENVMLNGEKHCHLLFSQVFPGLPP